MQFNNNDSRLKCTSCERNKNIKPMGFTSFIELGGTFVMWNTPYSYRNCRKEPNAIDFVFQVSDEL